MVQAWRDLWFPPPPPLYTLRCHPLAINQVRTKVNPPLTHHPPLSCPPRGLCMDFGAKCLVGGFSPVSACCAVWVGCDDCWWVWLWFSSCAHTCRGGLCSDMPPSCCGPCHCGLKVEKQSLHATAMETHVWQFHVALVPFHGWCHYFFHRFRLCSKAGHLYSKLSWTFLGHKCAQKRFVFWTNSHLFIVWIHWQI